MAHSLIKLSNKYLIRTWTLDDFFGKGTGYLFVNGDKQVSVCDRSESEDKINVVAKDGPSLYLGNDIREAAIRVVEYLTQ